jgi:hypothetical protein
VILPLAVLGKEPESWVLQLIAGDLLSSDDTSIGASVQGVKGRPAKPSFVLSAYFAITTNPLFWLI